MIRGAGFMLAGLILALLMPSVKGSTTPEQTVAVLQFCSIMGGASVFLGGIWLIKSILDYVQT